MPQLHQNRSTALPLVPTALSRSEDYQDGVEVLTAPYGACTWRVIVWCGATLELLDSDGKPIPSLATACAGKYAAKALAESLARMNFRFIGRLPEQDRVELRDHTAHCRHCGNLLRPDDVEESAEIDGGDPSCGYGGGEERTVYRVHDSHGCGARYEVDGEELDALYAEEGGAS